LGEGIQANLFVTGTDWEYGINLDWVGLVIEAVTGQTLGEYMKQYIFDPLGMHSSTFVTSEEQNARHAFMHQRGPDKHLSETDPKIAYGEKVEVHLGGVGLHSTPADYSAVLHALLNEGVGRNGAQILKKDSVDVLFKDQTTPMGIALEKTLVSVVPEVATTAPLVPGVPKAGTFGGLMLGADLPSGRSAGSVWWAGVTNCFW
jgi:methyl acetate hydrolase